ncbi:hypothetical protein E2I00_007888 [Balaenoptera physalus]|uniref:VWFA domain-containing protein n=1 Tax=Balaenoptera physalus TaxID=9770 RepID=A0A643BNT0_BALPH|nr:hypothetical protein E2I00_007888 [Balaenoptera physalus]
MDPKAEELGPNLRMSFITYSTLGHTLMKLTSDRPLPASAENKVPSMIISLTDGTLEEAPFEMTKEEADKARKMGATVYCVGVKDFEEDQLLEIADSPRHVFGVDQGFKALKYIVEPLGTKSCIEITAVEPSSVCTGDENELMISGKGFNNAEKKDEVICRFKFSDKQFFDIKAKSVKDTSITCPGVKIEKPDQEVFVEVSLNNGVSVINNNVSITSKNCASTRFVPYVNPLYFSALIPALLLFLLVLWCIWWLCRRKTTKEPPPVQKSERRGHHPSGGSVCACSFLTTTSAFQGKLDTLCDFVQRCNQMSLMWCPPRDMGKCLNFALMKPHCGQLHCSPKVCLQPSRECFSVNSCCSRCQCPPPVCSRLPSRMQPLISPPARPRCGATLSLQPP